MVGNVLSVFRLPPQQKTTIPHLLLTTYSLTKRRTVRTYSLLLPPYSFPYASSMAASTIVRFAFENARPMSVSVLPLPANFSA